MYSRNGDVTYHLSGDSNDGTFSIDSQSGVISLIRSLDREKVAKWKVK